MKTKLKQSVVFMLLLSVFFACNQSPKSTQNKFVLNGTLKGIKDGKITMMYPEKDQFKTDTALIENGRFTFTGDFPEPIGLQFSIEGKNDMSIMSMFNMLCVYAENAHYTLTGHADTLMDAKTVGGTIQDGYYSVEKAKRDVRKKYNLLKLYEDISNEKTSAKRKAEIQKIFEKYSKESDIVEQKFINANPGAYYSAVIIRGKASGKSAETMEKMLSLLDPSLETCPIVVELREKIAKLKNTEVSVDKFITNASNVTYKVDNTFKGKANKGIKYLAVFKNDNICALKEDGTVQILNPAGGEVSNFNAKLNGNPSSIAVDKADNIYVMAYQEKKMVKKIRGKEVTRTVPCGVECTVFNKNGEKQNTFSLDGIKTATGARLVDNRLMVSDCMNRLIGIFDAKTGEMASKIDNMRPCCGILDFSVNAKKEILVANLGAFRVQSYDLTGKSKMEFGQRGKSLDEFHGCCNPVSVANLSNGAIVTVEKDPTRIKVYSKEGAKQIAGIEELVKGCSYIPMIVDSKDNLYLASGKKGMVKCVSIN